MPASPSILLSLKVWEALQCYVFSVGCLLRSYDFLQNVFRRWWFPAYRCDRFVVLFATLQIKVTRFGPNMGAFGPQMGQIWDFFTSKFSTFRLGEPTVLETIRNIHTYIQTNIQTNIVDLLFISKDGIFRLRLSDCSPKCTVIGASQQQCTYLESTVDGWITWSEMT